MIIRALFIISFLIVGQPISTAQDRVVTDGKYEALMEEAGFNDTKKGLRLREKFLPKPEEEQVKKNYLGAALLLQLLAYAMVVALIILILYLLLSNVQRDTAVDPSLLVEDEIEDIEDIDADAAYKAALVAQNYRLAIRMHFIKCLQQLTQKEHIIWEKEKTNRHYFREIADSDIKYNFREIATIFERCWYSDIDMDINQFGGYDQRFLSFLNNLK